jgi:hypothetical protein
MAVITEVAKSRCKTCGRYVGNDPLEHIRLHHNGQGVIQTGRGIESLGQVSHVVQNGSVLQATNPFYAQYGWP